MSRPASPGTKRAQEPDSLGGALEAALGPGTAIVGRVASPYASGSHSGAVRCRVPGAQELDLFWKLQDDESEEWSDVAYEAKVYRSVLESNGFSTPRLVGDLRDEAGGSWLFLELLAEAKALDELGTRAAMALAAAWLGRFHAAGERLLSSGRLHWLKSYGPELYRSYTEAVARFGDGQGGLAWLDELRSGFAEGAAPLIGESQVIVHADFYANNILLRGDDVCPVDWEHAGIGPGGLDLACLTDGWDADVTEACRSAYESARWPGVAPTGASRVLEVGRLCLALHELAALPDWASTADGTRWARQLREAAERLGLLPAAAA